MKEAEEYGGLKCRPRGGAQGIWNSTLTMVSERIPWLHSDRCGENGSMLSHLSREGGVELREGDTERSEVGGGPGWNGRQTECSGATYSRVVTSWKSFHFINIISFMLHWEEPCTRTRLRSKFPQTFFPFVNTTVVPACQHINSLQWTFIYYLLTLQFLKKKILLDKLNYKVNKYWK